MVGEAIVEFADDLEVVPPVPVTRPVAKIELREDLEVAVVVVADAVGRV